MNRRSFLTGLVGFVAAPAIVRVSSIMPVKAWADPLDLTHFRLDKLPIAYDEMTATEMQMRLWAKEFLQIRPCRFQQLTNP